MNLEQKNTLFVVTLVLLVLGSVAAMAYLLISQHVEQQIDQEMQRAHTVFVEAQKQGFQTLQYTAGQLSEAPAVLAAALTRDPATIRDALGQSLPDSGLDLLALYRGGAHVTGIGQSGRLHLVAPRVLDSEAFVAVARRAAASGDTVYGHALVFDSLLRLVARPVTDPAGGQLGVLLVAAEIGANELRAWRGLIGAEVLLYHDNLVLGGTLQRVEPPAQQLTQRAGDDRFYPVKANGNEYLASSYPLLTHVGGDPVARVLLAVSADTQWNPYRLLAQNAFYFALLILLVAALVGIWISRSWLTLPVKGLARITAAIGDGDLDVKVTENRTDELGDLARSFNRMLDRLRASQSEELHARQRFHDFAESSSDWLWETDAEARLTYVSQNVVSTTGLPADDLLGHTFGELFPQDNTRAIMAMLRPGNRQARPLKDVELWVTNREGIRLCLRLSAMPYGEDAFRGYRGTARDITKAKNDQERLVHLANRDHLTGLSNRRRFMEELARELAVARRQGHSGALMLIDLDHFKLVNDTAGHAAGDEVIVQIGGMLRRMARSVDLVARLSGDEFVIALINTTPEQAHKRADELLNHIGQLRPTYGGRILNTSASIGIVIFPRHGQTPVELLAKADTAMYAAKKGGRNRTHLYSEADMDQALMGSQLTWKDRIHEALEADLFELSFQPIMPTRKMAAPPRFEVLVRLRASDGTLHMPGSFIPTAEQFGLIRQVDAVVLQKAVRALAALPKNQPVSLSINLSGISVGDRTMLELIESELDRAGIDHRRIIFEITESAACQDINRASEFIQRIQQLGCRIALDDFGVGFSSFSYLKHLHADVIKIDGSFIRDIHNSVEDQLFVKALVDVARGMGMQTTAEFVESAEAFERVRALGVDYVQGFYVGRPQALPGTASQPTVADPN